MPLWRPNARPTSPNSPRSPGCAAPTHDPLVALLIDAAIAHTKTDLQLVDTATERLAPLARPAAPSHEATEEAETQERSATTP